MKQFKRFGQKTLLLMVMFSLLFLYAQAGDKKEVNKTFNSTLTSTLTLLYYHTAAQKRSRDAKFWVYREDSHQDTKAQWNTTE